jgi:hypothetical protein
LSCAELYCPSLGSKGSTRNLFKLVPVIKERSAYLIKWLLTWPLV